MKEAAKFKDIPPLHGAELVLATLGLSLAVFMIILDGTIANVALPTIAGNLGAATSQGTWVVTSFAVANAISIPLTGWLSRRFGEVKVFLVATVLFVTASFLCGISVNLEMLIMARVMQGAVAGPIVPLSQSLLMACYPPVKRTMALGLWSMMIVLAPIAGPMVGGWITNNWHWGWIFFINIPFGALVSFFVIKIFLKRETTIIKAPVDYVGLTLLVVGVGALQMILDMGKELGWFESPKIIALFAVMVVCLVYFVIWELFEENPIVDLKLFLDRNFTVATICACLAFMVYMGTIVLLPLLLQTQYGYTAIWAGLATAPIGIIPMFLTPAIARFAHRVDMRIVISMAFVVFSFIFFWRSTYTNTLAFKDAAWPQFWQGLGTSMFFMPLTAISFSRIPGHLMAQASALSNFLRTLAGGIGTSVVTTMWARRATFHQDRLSEAVSATNPNAVDYFSQMTAAGIPQPAQHALVTHEIVKESFIMSGNDIYWAAGFLFLFLIVTIWAAKPPFGFSSK